MHTLTLVLRLVHIVSGVFWAGTAMFFFFVLGPAMNATGDVGRKFGQYLVLKARMTAVIASTAGLTVMAGLSLYLIDSGGLTSPWMTSGAGIGFALGGLAGLVAFVLGIMFGRNNDALAKIGSQLQGLPSPEQMANIQGIQRRQKTIGLIMIIALFIAVACMATARYWLI
jgi:uncharacterized membrane protein